VAAREPLDEAHEPRPVREARHEELAPEVDAGADLACVGAIHELVTDHVIHRGAATLPDLPEPIVEIERTLLLAPVITRAGGGPLAPRPGATLRPGPPS
jgi:hypothetical protein